MGGMNLYQKNVTRSKIKKHFNIKLNWENYLMTLSCRENAVDATCSLLLLVKVKSLLVFSVTNTLRRCAIQQSIQIWTHYWEKPGSILSCYHLDNIWPLHVGCWEWGTTLEFLAAWSSPTHTWLSGSRLVSHAHFSRSGRHNPFESSPISPVGSW